MRAGLRTPIAMLLATAVACSPAAYPGDPATERTLAALDRSLDWLERHPADRGSAIGQRAFDAWSWFLFSRWHPDASVRERAGAETDRRLRALQPPAAWNQVSLSYFAVLLRIAALRGIDLPGDPPEGAEIDEVLRQASPTTAFWTASLLRHAGVVVAPDPAGTLLERGPGNPDYLPTVADAYAVFHELVPATGLATVEAAIPEAQMRFVRRSMPGWIEVCLDASDTDCVAELLVVAALVEDRSAGIVSSLDWLLSRQQTDGTYIVSGRRRGPDDFRHVVLVSSWALLASLDTFETRVGVRNGQP